MSSAKTVFLVDDDVDDQELFIEAMREINPLINCISAFNGQEGLTILNQIHVKPDYIFLDLNMPKINGKQCLAEIKKNERVREIPVIIYSTSSLDTDIEETRLLGASYFLAKPSRFADLKKAIEYILNEATNQPGADLKGFKKVLQVL